MLEELKLYAGIAVLVLIGYLGIRVHTLKADNAVLHAQVDPLKQAVNDADAINGKYRTALQQCEDSKVRVAKENFDAGRAAAENTKKQDAATEDFNKRLAKPDTTCTAIKQVQVCPALMDY